MIVNSIHQGVGMWLVMFALIALEIGWRLAFLRSGYDFRSFLTSMGVMAGGQVVKPVGALLVSPAYLFAEELAPIAMDLDDWRTWAIAFLATEYCYYWFHRASHTIRWMWATHAVHHTPRQITLATATRMGWTDSISLGWLFFLPPILLGIPAIAVVTMLGINLAYQFGIHTEVVGKLGRIELVLNTPSNHRVHHASNHQYLDCNFGGIVMLFDHLHGTYRPEPTDETLVFGLESRFDAVNPIRLALHEWENLIGDVRKASLRHWPAIVFGKPGSVRLEPD